MSDLTVDQVLDIFCEYRSDIRELIMQAQKENWSHERLEKEINKVSIDIDVLLHYYKEYKDFYFRLSDKIEKMSKK